MFTARSTTNIYRLITTLIIVATFIPPPASADTEHHRQIRWRTDTMALIARDGYYGRMVRLPNHDILCTYERYGTIQTCISSDDGHTWGKYQTVKFYRHGLAANPELLVMANGWILLSYNERPRDGKHKFAIRCLVSKDLARSWTTCSSVYEAGTAWENGCWEPAQIQLPSGEIQLFFANESPYRRSNEQEISMARSFDNGLTWTTPTRISFRKGHRDGMPVPLLLNKEQAIIVAIEDNGVNGKFKPVILYCPLQDNWNLPFIAGHNRRRWLALAHPLNSDVYAGAPYIRRFPDGCFILSCQSDEDTTQPIMVVYLAEKEARNFTAKSVPFPVDKGKSGKWNSLFIKNAHTVIALSSTTIRDIRGLWKIEGQLSEINHD